MRVSLTKNPKRELRTNGLPPGQETTNFMYMIRSQNQCFVNHEASKNSLSDHRARVWLAALICLAVWPVADAQVLTNADPVLLQQALDAGGRVVFSNFSGVILLTNTLTVSTTVTLDGGNWRVQLSGGGTVTNATNSAGSTNGSATVFSVPSANGRRIFNVAANGQLTLLNLVLANGRGNPGGAILNYGTLVLSNCALVGNGAAGVAGANGTTAGQGGANSTQPGGAGAAALGGAVCNYGVCAAQRSLFLNNTAVAGNGGDGGDGITGGAGGDGAAGGYGGSALGGAIYSTNLLTIQDCAFSQNLSLAGNGGRGGDYGLGYSTPLAGGTGAPGGTASGGAVCNASVLGNSISGSTFMYNSGLGGDSGNSGFASGYTHGPNGPAGGDGRGAGICNKGTLALWNSTFFHNKAAGGKGGAGATNVSNGFGGDGGAGGRGWAGAVFTDVSTGCYLTNCTLLENNTLGGYFGAGGTGPMGSGGNGPAGAGYGGNVANVSGTFTLRNCLLGNAPGGTGVSANAAITTTAGLGGTNGIGTNGLTFVTNSISVTNISSGANAYGTFATDSDYNLSSDATPASFGAHSMLNTNPKLAPLAFNGGPVPTIALLTNSPALDKIDPPPLPDSFWPATDARGVARPQGGRGDIGAFELEVVNLSGYITNALAASPVAGVLITITAPPGVTNIPSSTTDANGYYAFTNLPSGAYTLFPQLDGYKFTPTVRVVAVGSTPINTNFTATGIYAVYGHVTTNGSGGLSNVLVTAGARTSHTDATGYYEITGLAPGQMVVVPSLPGYIFLPSSSPVSVVDMDVPADFGAVRLNPVSGTVTNSAGQGVSGVTVTVISSNFTFAGQTGSWTLTTNSSASGSFLFSEVPTVPIGAVVVRPSLMGSGFSPPQITVINLSGPMTSLSFRRFAASSISGSVTLGGSPLPGVMVSAIATDGTQTVTAQTDSLGAYAILGLTSTNYTMLPQLGYAFSSTNFPNLVVPVPPDSTNVKANFAAQGALGISGNISLENGTKVSGVSVVVGSALLVTDASGFFNATNLTPGDYTVTPYLAQSVFSPANRLVHLTTTSTNNQYFTVALLCNIHGRVTLGGTNALAGVLVTATNAGSTSQATSGADGSFTLIGVKGGANVTVTPTLLGYAFSPPVRTLALWATTNNVNFTASSPHISIARSSSNSIRLTVLGLPLHSYAVQINSNLTNLVAPWQTMVTSNTSSNGTFTILDTNLPSNPVRFYRPGTP